MLQIKDINFKNKRVLLRADLNVPLAGDIVMDSTRIKAIIPTLQTILKQNASVLIMSHLGRPTPGSNDHKFSLEPVAKVLQELLGQTVKFFPNWIEGVDLNPSEVGLAENVRFLPGETDNAAELGQKMAQLADIFVMDAFGSAHRKHASTYAVAQAAAEKCAGLLLTTEINALNKVLANPKRPLLAIVGGAKVAGKLELLHALLKQVDSLILGGGIANTFLAAQGVNIGNSLADTGLAAEAKAILQQAEQAGKTILLPQDVIVAQNLDFTAEPTQKDLVAITDTDAIFDIGPRTIDNYCNAINAAATILWNGPVGVFEDERFTAGTEAVAKAVAAADGYSVAGGGDTIAAIGRYDVAAGIDYISTGGGAFLEYIEKGSLPGIEVLE